MGGYAKGNPECFDADPGVLPRDTPAFIKATQPQERDYLAPLQKGKAEETALSDLCRVMDSGHEG